MSVMIWFVHLLAIDPLGTLVPRVSANCNGTNEYYTKVYDYVLTCVQKKKPKKQKGSSLTICECPTIILTPIAIYEHLSIWYTTFY